MDKLSEAWLEYEEFVFQYAKRKFEIVVLPFLVKNGYIFAAGNGDWFIGFDNDYRLYDNEIPERILNVLKTEIPGFPANDLGSLMPNHNPKQRKSK